MKTAPTTGLPALDGVMHGLRPGDNVVWQVQSMEDYRALVVPYATAASRLGERLIYFRFGDHPALLPPEIRAEVHRPDPEAGFEAFVEAVHSVIEDAGEGAWYVFDNLSVLAEAWQSDQTLGNFFMLTCPRLFDLQTVTYFGLLRNWHSSYAIDAIRDTTQFMLDIFRRRGRLYIRPIKVQHRSAEVMNLIHEWEGDTFRPVNDSATVSEILADAEWPGLQADMHIGYWRRFFMDARAQAATEAAGRATPRTRTLFRHAVSLLLGDDPPFPDLAAHYLRWEDVFAIRDRQIGVGRVGGKAAGMLLARAILRQDAPELHGRLEAHDSFYVGSEVFTTFMVINKLWWERSRRRDPATMLDGLHEIESRIMRGRFPDYTLRQFEGMLEYFGEWPFIVRSSSLLEDAYGNAFAGKYESVFCVNRGTWDQRMAALLEAVRRVYASTMSEDALQYRLRRGLLDRQEQMALLIMRVSGSEHGRYFYPQSAGVGLSFNPYPWNPAIEPHAGVVRLVFGLGTRAVNRADDDYTRLVALNAPDLRPETQFETILDASQQRMDVLDLSQPGVTSAHHLDVLPEASDIPLDMFVAEEHASGGATRRAITFDGLLRRTPFADDLRHMLATLERVYAHPVEIEFALNFLRDGTYRIHLLQCRTLQVRGGEPLPAGAWPEAASRRIEAGGAVIGMSRDLRLDAVVHVVPEVFAGLSTQQRHEVARLVGRLNRVVAERHARLLLLGPGRWGTRDPALGVPVNFAEINHVAALCEIVAMHGTLVPDVSLGTHFLNEMVEMDILYFALFPNRPANRLDPALSAPGRNRLAQWVPSAAAWAHAIRVFEAEDLVAPDEELHLVADTVAQRVAVFASGASG